MYSRSRVIFSTAARRDKRRPGAPSMPPKDLRKLICLLVAAEASALQAGAIKNVRQGVIHRHRLWPVAMESTPDEPSGSNAAPPGPPTAPAADIFAGMRSPIPVDSPEGRDALARLGQEGTPPAGPPTALAADVFAGMQSPISVDSPEGQERLARLQAEAQDGPQTSSPPSDPPPEATGLTAEKVRELLDSGLGDAQVRALLKAEGVPPDTINSVLESAQALPAAVRAPPAEIQPPPPPPPPPTTTGLGWANAEVSPEEAKAAEIAALQALKAEAAQNQGSAGGGGNGVASIMSADEQKALFAKAAAAAAAAAKGKAAAAPTFDLAGAGKAVANYVDSMSETASSAVPPTPQQTAANEIAALEAKAAKEKELSRTMAQQSGGKPKAWWQQALEAGGKISAAASDAVSEANAKQRAEAKAAPPSNPFSSFAKGVSKDKLYKSLDDALDRGDYDAAAEIKARIDALK